MTKPLEEISDWREPEQGEPPDPKAAARPEWRKLMARIDAATAPADWRKRKRKPRRPTF